MFRYVVWISMALAAAAAGLAAGGSGITEITIQRASRSGSSPVDKLLLRSDGTAT